MREKQSILDFFTGAENSGKAWFATFYITPDGKEQHDVVTNKIDDSKEWRATGRPTFRKQSI